MKCPECEKLGTKSTLNVPLPRPGDTSIIKQFYDEDGRYHYHDANTYKTLYKCSLGHLSTTFSYHGCPSCGDTWRPSEGSE